MAKKLETIKLVAGLEKATRKTDKAIWEDLAQRLNAPSRNNMAINLDKLSQMAKKFEGKILVVPGKVLAQGELDRKVTIVAVAASEVAKKKIAKKGEFILLKDFAAKADKVDTKKLVIIK